MLRNSKWRLGDKTVRTTGTGDRKGDGGNGDHPAKELTSKRVKELTTLLDKIR
jgi:hypothetical protein